ncbi:phosphate ABC transporter ATP-binding protein PstB [Lyngbya sp. PCC 8106]|uniref:phosphate ABC transporter ATP-binding protein PstB n=1 Tax=Lyngbya sp. (strain PCC 8106) TaxID=313612 RepID=UPI0000EACE34|nr:phosphate ABC transporter ATP-binding protein PstB [Lyngbya sp. PCC 8106]EAW34767.1 ATP-binding protein of phosphate ABC transporter [Lyngbya sp. PCC 8106]
MDNRHFEIQDNTEKNRNKPEKNSIEVRDNTQTMRQNNHSSENRDSHANQDDNDSQKNRERHNSKNNRSNQSAKTFNNSVFTTEQLSVYYGDTLALSKVNMEIPPKQVTALIGPSGCGKSTLIRCFNRLNDLIDSFHTEGKVFFHDKNLYSKKVDAVKVRRKIGMVFQKPNPFPKSIYDNIAYGARINNYSGDMDELVENSLKKAALWTEVKDKLKENALSLSGGQKQRLCIARAVALKPEVILMDEPCSSLDPVSTQKVEDLIHDLKESYTVVIVTHNMQQATRVADLTAFFNAEEGESGNRFGYLVEYDETEKIFQDPQEEATQKYVSGSFG